MQHSAKLPPLLLLLLLTLVSCGGRHPQGTTMAAMNLDDSSSESMRSSRPVAIGSGVPIAGALGASAAPQQAKAHEALVIQGFITARVDDVRVTTEAIAEQVRNAGGRVVRERGNGAKAGWSSFIRVRLPPEGVDSLVTWLGENGHIEAKRIEAEDVSKQLFDQELALTNLNKTLTRMQALLERPDLDIQAVLKIENEMSRVRDQIETIKGSQRFLKDRVAYATIEFTLKRRDGVERGPKTKFMAGMRLARLSLLDPEGRARHRTGLGLTVASPMARLSYELDVFEATGDEKRAVLATAGGAAYSDHLGGGRRRFLNPYVGLRLGYGHLNGSNFVLAGEAGVELFKHRYAAVDLNVRGTSFFGKGGPDLALVSAASLSVAF